MLTEKEAFHHIRRLHIETKHQMTDLFAGSYRSIFKGEGIEFEKVREYEPGDDVRIIDWNVSARSQKLFIKRFREERELTLILVIDISASTDFGHQGKSKRELIAELGALLALAAFKNQDKVGLLLISEEIELYLRPKKGTRHLLRLIRELLYFKPKKKGTNLEKGISFLGKIEKKRAICFIISDFLSPNFQDAAKIVAHKHELIACQVFDEYEENFDSQALFELTDLETGKPYIIDTTSLAVRKNFREKAKKEREDLKHLFGKIGIDFFSLNTKESAPHALYRFFREKKKKK